MADDASGVEFSEYSRVARLAGPGALVSSVPDIGAKWERGKFRLAGARAAEGILLEYVLPGDRPDPRSYHAPPPHPPPPSRTKWTRLVHPSVLIGHVSSLSPVHPVHGSTAAAAAGGGAWRRSAASAAVGALVARARAGAASQGRPRQDPLGWARGHAALSVQVRGHEAQVPGRASKRRQRVSGGGGGGRPVVRDAPAEKPALAACRSSQIDFYFT
jgi:hypothetical protein